VLPLEKSAAVTPKKVLPCCGEKSILEKNVDNQQRRTGIAGESPEVSRASFRIDFQGLKDLR